MKKNLFPLILLATLTAVPARAAQFWYDTITNLPLGCITTNPPSVNLNGANPTNFSNWYPHAPGSFTATDALIVSNNYTSGAAVSGRRLRVDGNGSEYIMRLFDPATTNEFIPNQGTILYASFIANASRVPAAGAGTYFFLFNSADSVPPGTPPNSVTNGFIFAGRAFLIGNTNGSSYPFTNNVGGTYWFGVANGANGGTGDPAAAAGNINNIIWVTNSAGVPIDLKSSMDVQVVIKYDIDSAAAYLGINPASEADLSGPTSDGGLITNALSGVLFRQRTGGGAADVRDVAVGTTFADVMTNVLANTVVQVATNFNTVSNWPGNPALPEVFATSIGGGSLSYQWYRISGGVTNAVGANSQKFLVSSLSASDTGNYFCAVTNSGGKGALSGTNFYINVFAAAGLGFTSQPAATNPPVGSILNLSCSVTGSGPLTFTWKRNGNTLTDGPTGGAGDDSVVSGSGTPTLSIRLLSTNETGDYTVTVTTSASVSPNSIT
ncbi:MAG: hypothetical protein DME25_11190, partial [Verrucomicrobia bacterium]